MSPLEKRFRQYAGNRGRVAAEDIQRALGTAATATAVYDQRVAWAVQFARMAAHWARRAEEEHEE